MAETPSSPTVFISYSWTSEEHVSWVVRLAERLMTDGVNVILDQWDLKEGHDKHVFMEQMVADANVAKVLVVCDRAYAEKANSRRGGVGTESQIISPEVYNKTRQEKFIPLLREWDESGDGRVAYLPVYFKNAIYIDFSDDERFEESYERLLRNVYGQPERKKPVLGSPPAHLFLESGISVKTAGKLERLKDGVLRGRPHVQAMLEEYLEIFAGALEDFRISPEKDKPFDDSVIESMEAFLPYRDNWIDFLLFVTAYRDEDDTYDVIHGFLEEIIPYQSRPEELRGWNNTSFDNYKFILYEMFMYLIALLLKAKRYKAAVGFLERPYHHTDTLGGTRFVEDSAEVFNAYVESLERARKQRLKLRQNSVTADYMFKRSTHAKVKFQQIFQADMVLLLRGYLATPHGLRWFPRCLPFGERGGTLEVFARATSTAGFKAIQTLFGVKNLADLATKVAAMFQDKEFQQLQWDSGFRHLDWEQLFNLRDSPCCRDEIGLRPFA